MDAVIHKRSQNMPSPLCWSQDAYVAAYWFAAEAHRGQTYPGTDLPYLMHLSFVTMEIMAALAVEPKNDGNLAVQCALLHDTIEDTDVTYEQVAQAFGTPVAQGVLALSKNPNVTKAERMQDSLDRIRQQPPEVWMVKLADRTTNLSAPPGYWTRDKIVAYRAEAIGIHRALHAASPYLGARLLSRIETYRQYE
jgi:(p)ppGpp synthase/HD superfamily hydrolase